MVLWTFNKNITLEIMPFSEALTIILLSTDLVQYTSDMT